MSVNQHGLARYIPEDIRLKVRQRCGYGCVICGSMMIEYEHFNPDFKDATYHDPNCITLLCGSCHGKVTRGFWSKSKVIAANANPISRINKYVTESIDIGTTSPVVEIGSIRIANSQTILGLSPDPESNALPLIFIEPPYSGGDVYLLSLLIFDSAQRELIRIMRNEVIASPEQWDINIIGGKLTVRSEESSQSLVMQFDPPNKVSIESMDMVFGVCRVIVLDGNLRFLTNRLHVELSCISIENMDDTFILTGLGQLFSGKVPAGYLDPGKVIIPYGYWSPLGSEGYIRRYAQPLERYASYTISELRNMKPLNTILLTELNGFFCPLIISPLEK